MHAPIKMALVKSVVVGEDGRVHGEFYITFNFSTFMSGGNTEIERLQIKENEYFTECSPCR